GPLDNPGYLRYRWNLGVAGIAGLGGGGDTDRYNTITGNVVRQSRGAGISFLRWKPESGHRPGADFAITGNTIEDVAYAGVHLYAAEGVTISGNTIANAGEGIAVVKARHCAVQNNLLRRCRVGLAIRSMDGWQADGETGPASEQNVITANALFACEMPIDIAADATDNTVDGNHVYPATDADAEASPTASVQP